MATVDVYFGHGVAKLSGVFKRGCMEVMSRWGIEVMKRWVLLAYKWIIVLIVLDIVLDRWSGASTVIARLLWTFVLVMALLDLAEFLSED
jgi:hypothetical protein